ncbi:helix-turn-helix domain-containing protein [Corallococcus exiguus]|uniref:helix-turn-helix domain-containing protein n=1 Tax=Corallococcus exiguus TaxID=83462 RepID=UPI00321195FB
MPASISRARLAGCGAPAARPEPRPHQREGCSGGPRRTAVETDRGSHTPAVAGCPLMTRRSPRCIAATRWTGTSSLDALVPGARDVVSQQNDGAGAPVPFPEMLTVEEAAAFLRVNRKTLYEAVRLGSVPGVVRLGRTIRINKSALIGWVQGNGGPALGEKQ